MSYTNRGDIQSPLDGDFFDLLQRLEPTQKDTSAVRSIIKQVRALPYDCWRSMERAFYTLHLRAYMKQKLVEDPDEDDITLDEELIREFAVSVQALLRKAHGKNTCDHHARLFTSLCPADTIVSFNYDLVPERAIRRIAENHAISFAASLYGLDVRTAQHRLPLILKLHGSSNWKLGTPEKPGERAQTIEVRTKDWKALDAAPGYLGSSGHGTAFPIFLPFWDKRIEQQPWLQLWRTAYERLATAEVVIVWGYSLPITDIKAEHLFRLALHREGLRLCVIDPSPVTQRRWRELLPAAHYFPYDAVEDFFAAPPPWWAQRQEHPILTAR